MATDGFFANLDDAELISLINVDDAAKAIAQRLFNQAKNSLHETKTSPFEIRAKACGRMDHQGGTKDDIAVVVAAIK